MRWLPLEWLSVASLAGFGLTLYLIPRFKEMFIRANLYGYDMSKKIEHPRRKIPEATGVISGCVFLMVTFVMIPVAFRHHLLLKSAGSGPGPASSGASNPDFPHEQFVQLLSALLSISCMLLLGFTDDVLDLKWRHKLLLPTLASLPLLVVYYVTANRTEVVVPLFIRPFLGNTLNLGILYYVYMGMLAVFCTNAINILAGINGLEVGQSVIIAASIVVFNLKEMDGQFGDHHRFSLYFLLPYLSTSLPLLYYNWYPSRVFAGDTFCYFSGMTLAVVAILGHFSKTLLLFFMPQVANFLYSVPQLFRLVPCPRHRLPKYDPESDRVGVSTAVFKESELRTLGRVALRALHLCRLARYETYEKDGELYGECNNLTLINFVLRLLGPLHERDLSVCLLVLQVVCSCAAFAVRYPLAGLFYAEVVA